MSSAEPIHFLTPVAHILCVQPCSGVHLVDETTEAGLARQRTEAALSPKHCSSPRGSGGLCWVSCWHRRSCAGARCLLGMGINPHLSGVFQAPGSFPNQRALLASAAASDALVCVIKKERKKKKREPHSGHKLLLHVNCTYPV